jgi:sigma-B regulation protein RsbU (phosphoserine phosphatase)
MDGDLRNVSSIIGHKEQSTIFIYGVSIALCLYSIGFILPQIFSLEISETTRTIILLLALISGGGSIIWSIIRYQFLDVTVLVRQSLVYTITSGLLVGLYILIVSRTNKLITSLFGEQTEIANIAFIVVALILFQPINIQLDNLIKKFFIKRSTDYRNVLEQLSRRLISVLDPIQLRNMIEKTLKSTILVDKVYFVLFDDKLDEYVLLPSDDQPKQIIIDRSDIFLGGVGQLEAPTMISSLSQYRRESALSDEMEKHHIQLILPLKDADHLLGFLALTEKVSGYRYNAEDRTMLGVISNQLVTVLTNARLYADSLEKQRLDEEMAMARQIQLDLLPKHPPSSESFSISAFSVPSRTIGGDFYDFIPKGNDAFGMVIADASGKGLPAALLVAQVQAMLRSEIGNNNNISDILGNLNRYVSELTASGKYATLFYGEFNSKSHEFRCANAGHNHPILVRADGSCEMLKKGGIIIGAFNNACFEDDVTFLNKDDILFLYTDGLSEAMNKNEEEYGEERIINYLIDKRTLSTNQIIEGILKDVRQFDETYPPRDDTTLIALKTS